MHPDALDAIQDPHPATGPRTAAGKATSSRNALQTGLYTAHDFIRPGEEEEYSQTRERLMAEISPVGVLEETFAAEIMGATWRLRRCRLVEAAFNPANSEPDPMVHERTEKLQKSVDRARAQSLLIIRRSVAEMRILCAERNCGAPGNETINSALNDLQSPAVPSSRQAPQSVPESGTSSFCKPVPAPPAAPPQLGRNTPCPCGSRNKYKRCCGKNAPPLLNMAA